MRVVGVMASLVVLASAESGCSSIGAVGEARRVEAGRVLSWFEARDQAAAMGGRLATTAELDAAGVDVGYDQWTPICPSPGDQETGLRSGWSNGDNAWANIGPRKYVIEYPSWGLDANTYTYKHLTYFFVIAPTLSPTSSPTVPTKAPIPSPSRSPSRSPTNSPTTRASRPVTATEVQGLVDTLVATSATVSNAGGTALTITAATATTTAAGRINLGVTFSGSLADFDATARTNAIAAVATNLGVGSNRVTITSVVAGSVVVGFQIDNPGAVDPVVPYYTPSSGDDGLSTGAIVGIVVGCVVAVGLAVGLTVYFCCCKEDEGKKDVDPEKENPNAPDAEEKPATKA